VAWRSNSWIFLLVALAAAALTRGGGALWRPWARGLVRFAHCQTQGGQLELRSALNPKRCRRGRGRVKVRAVHRCTHCASSLLRV
jgi:hypothetical protein